MGALSCYGLIIYVIMTFVVTNCVSDDPYSISQISPKSESFHEHPDELLETSLNFDIKPSYSIETSQLYVEEEKSDETHVRIERSAQPIINDLSSIPSSFDKLQNVESPSRVVNDPSGRYFNYNIDPTKTQNGASNELTGEVTVTGGKGRMGKNIEERDSFLLKRGPRLESASGSPTQNNVMLTVSNVSLDSGTNVSNSPRQNPNPDIQDIITGIVKLLNGNVNVHANTQTSRRPSPSRINNRGPPRISDSQTPHPIDPYEPSMTSTNRPPPYPFERPDGPVRPFLTGVPIPEQIVPSMQQNNRPGFISQNRPPWQRPRPRPPIFNNNRRPFPYKPLPPTPPEYRPEEDIQITTNESESNEAITNDNQTEANNLDNNNYEVAEEIENSEEEKPTVETPTTPNQMNKKKDEYAKKKDKTTSKKPISPVSIQATTTKDIDTRVTHTYTPSLESELETSTTTLTQTTTMTTTTTTTTTSTAIQSSMEDHQPTMITTAANTPTLPASSSTTTTSTSSPATHSVIRTSSQTPTLPNSEIPYHPRPGLVLDDPEFKPGGHNRLPPQQQRPRLPIQPSRPPGYGEIFDVTLSAIQGPGSGNGMKQTVHIKPYGSYPTPGSGLGGGSGQGGDIIVSPSGEDGFVSIDGKRTYINLFDQQTDQPVPQITPSSVAVQHSKIHPTQSIPSGITGTGYAVAETESPAPPKISSSRPHYRPRPPPQQPPVRIDTCIVGDDSTCDQAQNEKCKTDSGVSSCHCRPGYSRRKHREPCRKVVSIVLSLRVDKIYDRRIVWDQQLLDPSSEPYTQLHYEAIRAIDSAMSMTPFSDEFMKAKVNRIYQGDPSQGAAGVFVNLTLMLEENGETLRTSLKGDVQRHLLGVIHRRNNNIGNSALYVESPPGSVSALQDLDECMSNELNDCHPEATCTNIFGSFRCECPNGMRDPWSDQPSRAGRDCQTCPDTYCNNRGTCSYDMSGSQICTCLGSFYGSQCEIDGEVLGVAIGASVCAVIIIVLTLVCLVMWSRRWHREQKNAMGSPVFGYMTGGAQVKTPTIGQAPYQVTLEDRMRWAQIADVMAQANHYASEPVGSTRPSSAVFGYPTLQTIGNMNTLANLSNLGTLSMAGTMPIHTTLPPVPLPRIGLHSRSSGMRTLENSSSSEEEDRTDLLGRSFHVPRPKSRSNGSITNQSGIYYDVDYEPSGGGGVEHIYGVTMQQNTVPGPQGIPMSTYTAGKAPATYYMK